MVKRQILKHTDDLVRPKTSNEPQPLFAGDSAAKVDLGNNGFRGAGMDRKINQPRQFKRLWLTLIAVASLLAVAGFVLLGNAKGRTLQVDSQRILISSVSRGIFDDFIPVRGRVTPAKTLYLDAVEGGRVERVLVEAGARLNAGDLIVELSNASLQLSALGNEARVAEQLNNMRSIELSLEQNRLQHKRNLVDITYQIKMLTRQLSAQETLLKSHSVSQSQFDDTKDTLDWYKAKRNLTLESQTSDAQMQEAQLTFLKETGSRLESNLVISRQNLDNMNVRAPVAGTLSGFDIEVGQSIGRGERLGQIDTPDNYKLTAELDEFYLGRVEIGQRAHTGEFDMEISKIYPQVKNGQFQVDFTFMGKQPINIRRGQTLQVKLTLGDASDALLIPNGAFYQDTGGNWIFVVGADGSQALKRTVQLGRRNSRFIEVLDGLEVGEKVVTSPYTDYLDLQRLKLTKK